MTVTTLSDEEQTAFAAATRPVFEKWEREIGKDLVETARRDMRGE
jgi:TRAP-type C4-dicarboxylate transport system substrate-binding protein